MAGMIVMLILVGWFFGWWSGLYAWAVNFVTAVNAFNSGVGSLARFFGV